MFGKFFKKPLKEQLELKFERQREKINQDIYIRDIFVYPYCESSNSGEAYFDEYESRPLDNRLIDHIHLLAECANVYHKKYYCYENEAGVSVIKPDCLNKITRISLHEFSLYTKHPLSLDDFNHLIEAVHEIAKKQQSNVHLLLSSMAVIIPEDKKILNISMYVECGENAIVKTFCKKSRGLGDKSYGDAEPFTFSSNFVFPEKGDRPTISGNTIFSCKTDGGAEFTLVVEVCCDHDDGLGKAAMKDILLGVVGGGSIVSDQVDHTVTSNSTRIQERLSVSARGNIVQIDPKHTKNKVKARSIPNDIVNAGDFVAIKDNFQRCYEGFSIKKGKNDGMSVLLIDKPFFGSPCWVIPQEERKLGGFSEDLQSLVNKHNEEVKEEYVRRGEMMAQRFEPHSGSNTCRSIILDSLKS